MKANHNQNLLDALMVDESTKQETKGNKRMKPKLLNYGLLLLAASAALFGAAAPAQAQDKKPNIVVLMTDDTGWGDFGA